MERGQNEDEMSIPTPNSPLHTHQTLMPILSLLQTRFPKSIFNDNMTILKLCGAMVKGSESGGLIRSQVCLSAVGGILIPPPIPTSEGGCEEQCNEREQSPSQDFWHLP